MMIDFSFPFFVRVIVVVAAVVFLWSSDPYDNALHLSGCKRPLRYFFSPLIIPSCKSLSDASSSSSAFSSSILKYVYPDKSARIPHNLLLNRLLPGCNFIALV